MPRELIDKDKLLNLINEQMAKLHVCRNLTITNLGPAPDRPHGSNWNTYGLRRSGADHDAVECAEAVGGIIKELHSKYDIAE